MNFSRRVFGGTPDGFKLVIEYGPSFREYGEQHGGKVRLPKALATLELAWTSEESEAEVVERLAQRKSALVLERMEEHVAVQITVDPTPNAATFPEPRIKCSVKVVPSFPALRTIHASRTTASGTVSPSLMAALLKHCELKGVWKIKGAEGFGNWWANCTEVSQWESMRNLNLSYCNLTSFPNTVGELKALRILRLSHNKLTSLPSGIGKLQELEVLAADHNLLTSVPVELRHCTRLKEVNLENNRIATLVLDLRPLKESLHSLQLFGNPLDYLPELSPCTSLRSLSVANVRIMADLSYTRWEVEVAGLSYMSRGHKLVPLFGLTFRRSSLQHPLLAGALGRIAEDRANCELIAREVVAIQQLVLMALGEHDVVVRQACKTIGHLARLNEGVVRKLIAHDVLSAVSSLLDSKSQESQLCGLSVLSALATSSDKVNAEVLSQAMLARLHSLICHGSEQVCCAALRCLSELCFVPGNKAAVRQAEGLLATVVELAQKWPHKHRAIHPATTASRQPSGGHHVHEKQQQQQQHLRSSQPAFAQASKHSHAVRKESGDEMRKTALRVLAVLGENEQVRMALREPPIEGRGLRILAMDGGGMKGLAMVQILRALERRICRPLHTVFDLVVGTSTGAIIAVSMAVLRMDLDQVESIYTKLGQKVFNQAVATKEEQASSWSDSLWRMYRSSSSAVRFVAGGTKHDPSSFENLLKELTDMSKMGCTTDQAIDTACLGGPKVGVVSTITSITPAAPFLFRTYELPPEVQPKAQQIAACEGSSKFDIWQAVRGSASAPYYFDDFVIGEDRFQDGATVANNPAVIALQQAQLLWPDIPVEVVASMGCGSVAPAPRKRFGLPGIDIGGVLFECACAVDRVHEALATTLSLVPGVKYFRFQPMDERCDMALDDIEPASWKKLLAAAEEFCVAHSAALDDLAAALLEGAPPLVDRAQQRRRQRRRRERQARRAQLAQQAGLGSTAVGGSNAGKLQAGSAVQKDAHMGSSSIQKPGVIGKPLQAPRTGLSGSDMDIDVDGGSSACEDSLTGSEAGSDGVTEDGSSMSEEAEEQDGAGFVGSPRAGAARKKARHSMEGAPGHTSPASSAAAIRLGRRRGLLVLEAPRATLPHHLSPIELCASALATLPHLVRRTNLQDAASAITGLDPQPAPSPLPVPSPSQPPYTITQPHVAQPHNQHQHQHQHALHHQVQHPASHNQKNAKSDGPKHGQLPPSSIVNQMQPQLGVQKPHKVEQQPSVLSPPEQQQQQQQVQRQGQQQQQLDQQQHQLHHQQRHQEHQKWQLHHLQQQQQQQQQQPQSQDHQEQPNKRMQVGPLQLQASQQPARKATSGGRSNSSGSNEGGGVSSLSLRVSIPPLSIGSLFGQFGGQAIPPPRAPPPPSSDSVQPQAAPMAIPGSTQGTGAGGALASKDVGPNVHTSNSAASAPVPPISNTNTNTNTSSPSSSFFDYFNPSKWGASPAHASTQHTPSLSSSHPYQHNQQQHHQLQHSNAQALPPPKTRADNVLAHPHTPHGQLRLMNMSSASRAAALGSLTHLKNHHTRNTSLTSSMSMPTSPTKASAPSSIFGNPPSAPNALEAPVTATAGDAATAAAELPVAKPGNWGQGVHAAAQVDAGSDASAPTARVSTSAVPMTDSEQQLQMNDQQPQQQQQQQVELEVPAAPSPQSHPLQEVTTQRTVSEAAQGGSAAGMASASEAADEYMLEDAAAMAGLLHVEEERQGGQVGSGGAAWQHKTDHLGPHTHLQGGQGMETLDSQGPESSLNPVASLAQGMGATDPSCFDGRERGRPESSQQLEEEQEEEEVLGGAHPGLKPQPLIHGALQDLREEIGVVHLGLHACARGRLVTQWRHQVMAVVDPSPQADALLQQLRGASNAHSAQHTSLSDITGSGPCLVGDTLVTRISKQELTTPVGGLVTSLLLHATSPAQTLHPEDVLGTMPDWTNLLISSATPLATPMVEAFLKSGAKAVVAPAPAYGTAASPRPAPLDPTKHVGMYQSMSHPLQAHHSPAGGDIGAASNQAAQQHTVLHPLHSHFTEALGVQRQPSQHQAPIHHHHQQQWADTELSPAHGGVYTPGSQHPNLQPGSVLPPSAQQQQPWHSLACPQPQLLPALVRQLLQAVVSGKQVMEALKCAEEAVPQLHGYLAVYHL